MSVCIVDTSILCEFFAVPRKSSAPEAYQRLYAEKVQAGEQLLLPLVSVIETGNHIGQNGDGGARRAAAARLVLLVRKALEGDSPFTPTPALEKAGVAAILQRFPEWALQGLGARRSLHREGVRAAVRALSASPRVRLVA